MTNGSRGKKTTIILGGGFGGLTVARRLRQLIPPKDHEVILIDRSPSFLVGATKTWVMLGENEPVEVQKKRTDLLPRDVRLVEAEVTSINARQGSVSTGARTFRGDFLVIALGASLNMRGIPGLAESAHTFYTVEGAERLRDVLERFSGGQVIVLIPRIPFQCPPAPYEAALLLDDFFKKRGIRAETRLSIYSIEGAPMTTAGPEIGNFVKGQLAEHNIDYHPLHTTTAVDPSRRRVMFENGASAEYDLLIAIPPHEAPSVVREAGLTGPSGWIPVDPKTMRVKSITESAVYAIGDVAGIPLPGRFKPDMPLSLPKAGTLAESQGNTVASQIAAQIQGGAPAEFDGRGFCFIELGAGTAIRGDGDFFAEPNPVMRPGTPGEEAYRAKQDWVSSWLSPR